MFKFAKPMTTTAARMIARKSRLEVMPMAKKYTESDYQRELTYRRSDYSFPAFCESDVTHFKRGEVHHKLMQGGASEGGFTLTAYVLVALLENHVQNKVTELARSNLVSHLADFKEDPYALTLCTYVLHLANSPEKGDVLKMLEGLQTTDGMVHWTTKVSNGAKDGSGGAAKNIGDVAWDTNQYFSQPQSADVEMSAYALLTYMLLDNKEHALPIVRWLTAQRNSLGGFSSTQDTMALQWPGAFAEKTNSPFNLSIKVPKTTLFAINAQNEDDTTSDSEAHVWTGMRRMIGGGRKCRSSWYPWLGVGGKDASTVFDFTRVMQTRAVSTEGRDQQVRAEVAEKYIQLLEKMGHNEKAWMDKWDAKETAQNERWNLFVSAQSDRWTAFVSAQSDRWTSFVYFITGLFVSMFVGFAGLYYSMLSEFGEVKQLISAKQ